MTTTIVSHITTKNSTQYSEMKKQGLTLSISFGDTLSCSLFFRPLVEKIKTKVNCIH